MATLRSGEAWLIQLEPAWIAAARQPAVGNGDVDGAASAGDGGPVDPRSRPGRQQPPFPFALPENGNAGVVRAIAVRLTLEDIGIAVEAGGFGKQTPDIVAGPVAKNWRSVLTTAR